MPQIFKENISHRNALRAEKSALPCKASKLNLFSKSKLFLPKQGKDVMKEKCSISMLYVC